ncbi:MAG: metal-transporting ATPase, partial [Ruminiclostridium sp.]
NEGKTPLFFGKGDSFLGIIAIADAIKEDSRKAVTRLKNMGMRVVMLTGDNRRTAEAIARQADITEIVSDVLPDGKASEVNRLKKEGNVIMVGDGINDAPALTTADIGIAIGAGTDIAIESADAVLMKSSLSDVPAAVSLSRSVLRNIRQNLFWAFFYNALGIPLAAGAFVGITGWTLSPMFGAAAMSLSSFCVVTNALRLNLIDIYNPVRDRAIKTNLRRKEVKTMEITMKIEGMMCGHCEAAVKKALEAIDTVEEAIVSHEKGTAIVKLSKETDFAVLKKAVEDKDYKVIE